MIYKFKTKQDFIATAQEVAWKNRDHHDYLPAEHSTLQQWKPHDWIIEAMDKAYTQGLEDCRKIHEK